MEGVTLICDGGSKKDLARERPERTVWTEAPVTYTEVTVFEMLGQSWNQGGNLDAEIS